MDRILIYPTKMQDDDSHKRRKIQPLLLDKVRKQLKFDEEFSKESIEVLNIEEYKKWDNVFSNLNRFNKK